MTDKQQIKIEEMAKVIFKNAKKCDCRLCQDCEYHKKGNFGKTSCQTVAIATELVKHYQPKLPEGAVVLTRAEYNDLKGLEERFDDYLIKEIKETRKETAEKILKAVKEKCKELENKYSHLCKSKRECLEETCRYEGVLAVKRGIYEIAKQFGVEVDGILTLINELESENKTFLKSKTMWKRLHTEVCEENKKLKDRIAELEQENDTKLKQFAEMLKEKVYDSFGDKVIWYNDIDETLNEFLSLNTKS